MFERQHSQKLGQQCSPRAVIPRSLTRYPARSYSDQSRELVCKGHVPLRMANLTLLAARPTTTSAHLIVCSPLVGSTALPQVGGHALLRRLSCGVR